MAQRNPTGKTISTLSGEWGRSVIPVGNAYLFVSYTAASFSLNTLCDYRPDESVPLAGIPNSSLLSFIKKLGLPLTLIGDVQFVVPSK